MARPGLRNHPKFRRLVATLGEPRPHVIGYLESMWHVAYENGDPFLGDEMDVVLASEYPHQDRAGAFVKALETCGGPGRAGFIERNQQNLLEVHDLYDHAPDYVQRRMEREAKRMQRGKTISDIRREAGRKGGLAKSENQRFLACITDIPSNNIASGDNCNSLATSQVANGATPAPAPAPAPALDIVSFAVFMDLWNQMPGVIHCRKATIKRKAKFDVRSSDDFWRESLLEALKIIPTVPFLTGENDRGWRADVDWFLQPDSLIKVLEGKYGNGKPQQKKKTGVPITTAPVPHRFPKAEQ